ncbi:glutamine amidotransferase [Enterocloster aldenensis]|uniref:glutamine amidotransferase n=1 Tax=Enterocloster aldenensis TaxID=358742 RepID=UPI0014083D42
MVRKKKVLFIGETWMVHTVEAKGFDIFTADSYGTGTEYIKKALDTDEIEFHHIPCHLVDQLFPENVNKLLEYDVVMISDVGANTFLLPVETFLQCKKTPNKLQMIKEYVLNGGGFCMIGGYLSFMGIEGKGRYNDTPVEDIMPVRFLKHDDRVEHPEGLEISIDASLHEILEGMPEKITGILGYNRAIPKESCQVIAYVDKDPFIAVGEFGKGRSVAYTTDCAPHWSAAEFCGTDSYRRLWRNIVMWLCNGNK